VHLVLLHASIDVCRRIPVSHDGEHPACLVDSASSSAQSVMPDHPGASKNCFGGTYNVLP
jgi:hypothetical protein